jgi:tetratricopeptide (TPR) repeat protein
MKIYHRIIFTTLTLLLLSASAFSQNETEYADWLYEKEQFDFARYEYLKILHDAPSDSLVNYTTVKIARCYMENSQLTESIHWSENNLSNVNDSSADSLRLLIGFNYFIKEDYYRANIAFETLTEVSKSKRSIDYGLYHAGLSKFMLFELDEAEKDWNRVSVFSDLNGRVTRNLKIVEDARNIELKDPGKAALLGIIPGLGYFYADHKQTAVSALTVIGLLGYGTYQSFKNDNTGLGIFTGFLTVGWHLGSIYGSYDATHRYNQHLKEEYINQISY